MFSSDSSDSGDCNSETPGPLFERTLRCLPFDKTDKPELETGNRVIMPLSALDLIQTLFLDFPLFFKIEGGASDKATHCGVFEFTSEEGFIHLPRWMMRSLGLEEGEDVVLSDAEVSAGTFMKLQPHATAFVEVPDPKAVLEAALRGYACLSKGDTFMVRYGGRDYYLDVLEVGPGGEVVSLIDTDCSIEFAPPLDYVEPPPRRPAVEKEGGSAVGAEEAKKEELEAFTGNGHVLGGQWLGRVVSSGGSRSAAVRGSFKDALVEGKKIEKEKVELKGRGGRVAGGPSSGAAAQTGRRPLEEKKIEKDGGKGEVKKEFKVFGGKGIVLGGPSLGAAAESGGWSTVARGPSSKAVVVEEEKKRKKDSGKEEAKVEFKAFGGKGRVLGGPHSHIPLFD